MIRIRHFTIEGDASEAVAAALRALALGEPPEQAPPPQPLASPAVAPVAEETPGPILKLRFSERERLLLEVWVRDSGKSVVEWAKSLLLTVVGANKASAVGTVRALAPAPAENLPRAHDGAEPRHVEKEREFRTRVNSELNLVPERESTRLARVSIADHIRAAFGKDENFSLPALAELAYGRSTGETLAKLKMNIVSLVKQGHLARLGATSYRLIPESERRERETTEAAQ